MSRKVGNNIFMSFTDVALGMGGGFFLLLILAITLINQNKKVKDEDIKAKADIMISVEWPGNSEADVDLHVQIPSNQVANFARKDVAGASLDRDDLGTKNDTVRLSDGSKFIIRENWENVFVRKIEQGEYVVNVHMYTLGSWNLSGNLTVPPTPVKIKVERFNPYKLIIQRRVILNKPKQELTAVRFTVGENNSIKNIHFKQKEYCN
jgi:hypothetical protein